MFNRFLLTRLMSYVRMVGVLLLKWAWDGNVAMLEWIGQYKRLCIGSGYMGVKGYVFDLMIFHEH